MLFDCKKINFKKKNAIEKQMVKLQKTGRIRRVGPDKGGHW